MEDHTVATTTTAPDNVATNLNEEIEDSEMEDRTVTTAPPAMEAEPAPDSPQMEQDASEHESD